MATPLGINLNRVTQGATRSGWTGSSIAPRPAPVGTGMNIGTSGNIPSNILQAVGTLTAEQAFRQFMGGQGMGMGMGGGGGQAPPMMLAPPDPAGLLRAQTAQAQQAAAQDAALRTRWELGKVNQSLTNFPTLQGGIAPMGMSGRANLQAQQFGLQNQLAAIPQFNGWTPGFTSF